MLDLVTMEPKLAGELTAAEKYIIKSRLRYVSILLIIVDVMIIITVLMFTIIILVLLLLLLLLIIIIMVLTIRIEFWKAEETPSFICSSHRALLTGTTGLQVLPSPSSIIKIIIIIITIINRHQS